MVDRPPPSRFSVVERGGRLVVIDKETGQTPLSAAERMDLHNRSLGIEPVRPSQTSSAPDMSAAAHAESGLSARPAPAEQTAKAARPEADGDATGGRGRIAITERNKQPWNPQRSDRPPLKSTSAPSQIAARPAPAAGSRKTIVTGKWWDSKGPRTIELGAKGQQVLSGGFVTLFVVAAVAAIVALFIEPLLLFVGAFVLFRFGGNILGPIGAGLVDKAIAEKG